MSNLRNIVTLHVEQETLKEYYKTKLNSTLPREKEKTLKFLRTNGHIDQKVDKILKSFAEEVMEGSPEVKKRKKRSIAYNLVILVCTIGLAFAVNEKAWVFVSFLGIIQAIVQYLSVRD